MQREHLGSRLGFILLSAGCAIGIGNVWKFPYVTGQNGGAIFVLIYLICLVALGLPVMTMEFARLRRLSLPENSVIQEGEGLRFLDTQMQFYQGTDFLLAGRILEEDTFFGAELLGSVAAAPGILKALGCGQGTFRTPGTKTPFAMFLPLAAEAVMPAYFGFAFD